ncbi:hypothetical protein, partial [Clostridioides difficile]|uniref:hypothetical protein n=1 Tax=Clostridioides difficile TaxID=1496 RepID=UPI0018DEAF43
NFGLKGLGRTSDTILVYDSSGDQERLSEISASGAGVELLRGRKLYGLLHAGDSGLLLGIWYDNGHVVQFFDSKLQ